MNNKKMYMWPLVAIVFVLSLYICWLFYLYDKDKPIEVTTLFTGFLTVFATGYGAYLGAKISGDNSIRLMKDELIMSDLNTKTSANIKFLKRFENSLFEKVLKHPSTKENHLETLRDFEQFFANFNTIRRDLQNLRREDEDVSMIIRYPYENILQKADLVYEQQKVINSREKDLAMEYIIQKFSIDTDEYIISTDVVSMYTLTTLTEDNIPILNYKYKKSRIEEVLSFDDNTIDEEQITIEKLSSKELYNFYYENLKDELRKYQDLYEDFIYEYNQLKFKTVKDLTNYINDYYLNQS
ncbi:hypothetical protein ERX27_07410 [Macrococcus brunensis]|uniref:Uncharacterized protein n=1 Tax=Macrococcus brunensis TaxID=198483 RepID=A0A4R6BCX3_9STAP|nr:hypothetical protein [Macrococcus brunensis]TDL96674.1 hypothetical protein ERX27_07410 [Macrococcus brunensis]